MDSEFIMTTASDHIELSKPTFEYWIWAFGACFIQALRVADIAVNMIKSINYSFSFLFFASIFSAIAGGFSCG